MLWKRKLNSGKQQNTNNKQMLQMRSSPKQAKDKGNRGQIMEPLDLIAQNGM
jgi:hypothetical protein